MGRVTLTIGVSGKNFEIEVTLVQSMVPLLIGQDVLKPHVFLIHCDTGAVDIKSQQLRDIPLARMHEGHWGLIFDDFRKSFAQAHTVRAELTEGR